MSSIITNILVIGVKMGHWGVFFLMAIESSFLPLPSEVIVPPAAYLAQKGELNLGLVIVSGIAGNLAGATINYILGLVLGRPLIYALARTKWARLFLINEQRIQQAERYFLQFGNSATFIGRLIPGVRHLISLPAGFTRMKFKNFIFFTALGSTIWVCVLAVLGYWFGANEEIIEQYYQEISYAGLILALGFVLYLVYKSKKNKSTDA